jgi:vitamin B12 transporter
VHRRALFLIALCACSPLWAQQTPELAEVVVTSTRIETAVVESPSAVTVITREQIAASGAQDVSALINGTAGVVIKDNGPTSGIKSVSLRGSGSEQVLVLVDGMRLNSARDGTIDLSTISVESIDHIEIVRGAESALYGSSAIGGVINIITKKAGAPEMALSVTNRSYIPHDATEVLSTWPSTVTRSVAADPLNLVDTQVVDLSFAGTLGEVGLTAGASFTRSANGYTWNDTADINAWRRLPNSDLASGNCFGAFTAPLLGGVLQAKGTLLFADSGQPGSLTVVSDTTRQTETQVTESFSWKNKGFFMDALAVDLKGFYRYDELAFGASLHRSQTASLDFTQKLGLSDFFSVLEGGSVYYDYVDSTNYASARQRFNIAGFVSTPFSPTAELTITPSARYDAFTDFAGSFSCSLSAVYLVSEQASLRASFGSAYRVPTFNELYWYDPIYMMYGNLALQPETSYNAEMGGTVTVAGVTVDAALFTRLVLNNIQWLSDPVTFVYAPQNLNQTLYPGAELHARFLIVDGLSLEASYTFIYSFLLNDGTTAYTVADNRRVPFAPLHTAGAGLRYAGGVHAAGIEMRYVSDQYTDTANTASTVLPGYIVVDADYRFEATENLSLTLTAKNIFNALYYTAAGYPMQPFSFEAGLRLHL